MDIFANAILGLASQARPASRILAQSSRRTRDAALCAAVASLRRHSEAILSANARDLDASEASAAFRDRLTLTGARIEAMASGLEAVAALEDPVGRLLAEWTRPNGLATPQRAALVGRRNSSVESTDAHDVQATSPRLAAIAASTKSPTSTADATSTSVSAVALPLAIGDDFTFSNFFGVDATAARFMLDAAAAATAAAAAATTNDALDVAAIVSPTTIIATEHQPTIAASLSAKLSPRSPPSLLPSGAFDPLSSTGKQTSQLKKTTSAKRLSLPLGPHSTNFAGTRAVVRAAGCFSPRVSSDSQFLLCASDSSARRRAQSTRAF